MNIPADTKYINYIYSTTRQYLWPGVSHQTAPNVPHGADFFLDFMLLVLLDGDFIVAAIFVAVTKALLLLDFPVLLLLFPAVSKQLLSLSLSSLHVESLEDCGAH